MRVSARIAHAGLTDPPARASTSVLTSNPSGSPRRPAPVLAHLLAQVLATHPDATREPPPHTDAEIAALVASLRAVGVATIAVGHGRYAAARNAAAALTRAWRRAGGEVLATVDWPAEAASWLKPARRLVGPQPDGWVIVDHPAGCAHIIRRLTEQPGWSADRTFFTSADPATVAALLGTDTGIAGPGPQRRPGHPV